MILFCRTTRLAAPALAGGLLRVSQILILVALATASADPSTTLSLVAAFGIAAAFAVITDSGAATYLLAEGGREITREVLNRCLLVHASLGSAGAFSACLLVLLRFDSLQSPVMALVAFAIVVTPAVDSALRVVRTPLLVRGLDHRYAGPEMGIALLKAIAAGVVFITGDVAWLLSLPLTSALLLVVTWLQVRTSLPGGLPDENTTRSILVFGITGAATALYSQAPLLAAGFLLPIQAVAVLTICYRIVQPLEFVPATICQQAIPRLRKGRLRLVTLWVGLTAAGLTGAALIAVGRPVVETLFETSIRPSVVLILVAASMPLKFGSYALSAAMFANGLVREKLMVTVCVGLLVVIASFLVPAISGIRGTAAVTLTAEAMLSVALMLALRGRSRIPARSHLIKLKVVQ